MGPAHPRQRPRRRLHVQGDHARDRDRERLLAEGHGRRRRALHIKYAEGRPASPTTTRGGTSPTDGRTATSSSNASGEGGGTADLFSQTKNSVNCAFLRLLTSVGPPKVARWRRGSALTRPVGQYLSIGIGETAHSPLEMATVFSTFADDGIRHDPVFITRSRTATAGSSTERRAASGDARPAGRPHRHRRAVPRHRGHRHPRRSSPTGRWRARPGRATTRATPGSPATRRSSSPWCGWATRRAAARDDRTSAAIQVFGGTYPAIIWQKFMTSALAGQPVIPFIPPDEKLWPDRRASIPTVGATHARPGSSRSSTSATTAVDAPDRRHDVVRPSRRTTSSTAPTRHAVASRRRREPRPERRRTAAPDG